MTRPDIVSFVYLNHKVQMGNHTAIMKQSLFYGHEQLFGSSYWTTIQHPITHLLTTKKFPEH